MFRKIVLGIFVVTAFGSISCTRKKDLGNTLRFALREKIRSLDPAHVADHYSNVSLRRTYESLVQYHYLKRPYELEPLLCEKMPEISKDGLTYTFKIKKGVLFQDDKAFPNGKGRELVASDFIYSFKRIADPKISSDGWWIFDGKIAGLNEWNTAIKEGKADYTTPVEGLQAPDSHTLVLKLTKKNPLILHSLAMAYSVAVAKEVVDHYGPEFVNHPVGTGPFKLESYTSNQLIWVKSPTYRQEFYPTVGTKEDERLGLLADKGKPIPFVDKLIDDIVVEDQPAWLNFMQGSHDYMMKLTKDSSGTVLDQDHKPSKQIRDLNIQVLIEPGIWFTYFGFNMDDTQIGGDKNKFIRQAMSLAYDEAPTIEKFYHGLATKTESVMPPGVDGYDPKYKNPMREYNLAKARELLAKAGFPGGKGLPEFVLDTRTDSTARQLAEYFARSMAELGIKVNINTASWPELINKIRKKQSQIFAISWVYDYPDAENGWQLLYGKNESPGPNETNFKNASFDKLYLQSATMENGPKRYALFKQMQNIIEDQVPMIFGVNQAETRLAHEWVKNFKIAHSFELNVEKYLRVDTVRREEALKSGALSTVR